MFIYVYDGDANPQEVIGVANLGHYELGRMIKETLSKNGPNCKLVLSNVNESNPVKALIGIKAEEHV